MCLRGSYGYAMGRIHDSVLWPSVILLFFTLPLCCCSRPPAPGPEPSRFPVVEATVPAEEYVDLNAVLMESTFRLQGITVQDSVLIGTVFIFDLPCQGDSDKAVLVTSHHFLDSLRGDRALLGLRRKAVDGTWAEHPWWIEIRRRGKPLWVRHKDVDVAAICVPLPDFMEIPLRSIELLADERTFQKYEIHPGDELMCLGYSSVNGVHGRGGFPILPDCSANSGSQTRMRNSP